MDEILGGCQGEGDGQDQQVGDEGDGGQGQGAVRKAVFRIENGENFMKIIS